ncbi:MAG: hypothetical protein BWY76_01702 [bacterium ADurb.Bin429]|nr:MAG: hypothetical protein BWY76_01702 [bacterium ADurb.Bin429]
MSAARAVELEEIEGIGIGGIAHPAHGLHHAVQRHLVGLRRNLQRVFCHRHVGVIGTDDVQFAFRARGEFHALDENRRDGVRFQLRRGAVRGDDAGHAVHQRIERGELRPICSKDFEGLHCHAGSRAIRPAHLAGGAVGFHGDVARSGFFVEGTVKRPGATAEEVEFAAVRGADAHAGDGGQPAQVIFDLQSAAAGHLGHRVTIGQHGQQRGGAIRIAGGRGVSAGNIQPVGGGNGHAAIGGADGRVEAAIQLAVRRQRIPARSAVKVKEVSAAIKGADGDAAVRMHGGGAAHRTLPVQRGGPAGFAGGRIIDDDFPILRALHHAGGFVRGAVGHHRGGGEAAARIRVPAQARFLRPRFRCVALGVRAGAARVAMRQRPGTARRADAQRRIRRRGLAARADAVDIAVVPADNHQVAQPGCRSGAQRHRLRHQTGRHRIPLP